MKHKNIECNRCGKQMTPQYVRKNGRKMYIHHECPFCGLRLKVNPKTREGVMV